MGRKERSAFSWWSRMTETEKDPVLLFEEVKVSLFYLLSQRMCNGPKIWDPSLMEPSAFYNFFFFLFLLLS